MATLNAIVLYLKADPADPEALRQVDRPYCEIIATVPRQRRSGGQFLTLLAPRFFFWSRNVLASAVLNEFSRLDAIASPAQSRFAIAHSR
jgi:hypothetical protein